MAAFIGSSTGTAAATDQDPSAGTPAGSAVDDVMYAHVANGGTGSSQSGWSTPAGWERLLITGPTQTWVLALYRKKVTAADLVAGVTHTFPVAKSSQLGTVFIASYRGADATAAVDVQTRMTGLSTDVGNTPGASGSGTAIRIPYLYGNFGASGDFAAVAGWTKRGATVKRNANNSLSYAWEEGATATGDVAFATTSTGQVAGGGGMTFVIADAIPDDLSMTPCC